MKRRDLSFDNQSAAHWVLDAVAINQPLTEAELLRLAATAPSLANLPMSKRGKRVGLALKMLRDAGRIEKRLVRNPGTPPRSEWITAGHSG